MSVQVLHKDLFLYSAFDLEEEKSPALVCNTQKDRVKLNYSTAGIRMAEASMHSTYQYSWHCSPNTGVLAGVWPCGVITLIGELFGSESLSQVYAFLHTFVHENGESLSDMSKYQ